MTLHSIFRDICSSNRFSIEFAFGGDAVSCGDFVQRVDDCRVRLAAVGLGVGETVVYHGDQGLSALVVFWASVLEGAVFAPVDAGWPGYMLEKVSKMARPVVAIVDDELMPAWQALPAAPTLIPVSTLDFASGLMPPAGQARCPRPIIGISPAVPAAYLFTSGSTGEPKAVVLSHAALARSARLAIETFAWKSGERLLNLADPHTMSGLRNAFVAAPLAGMAWICAPKQDRDNVFALLECIERSQVQRMVAAPILLRHLNLLGSRIPAAALASLKALYCTGADLSADEVGRFHASFGIPVVNYYGLTETVGLCLSQDVDDWSVHDESVGRPVGCEVRIVNDAGAAALPGEVGELQVRLDFPMSGYLQDPAATSDIFDGPWLRTGDLVEQDADGRIRIVGRRGNFIKTLGTEKVQPQEIEAVLEQCPGVAEAAVFGWADPAGGERIVALIVNTDDHCGRSLQDGGLADFVRGRLGAARVPGVFRRIAAIPRSANGKILRKQLRDLI